MSRLLNKSGFISRICETVHLARAAEAWLSVSRDRFVTPRALNHITEH